MNTSNTKIKKYNYKINDDNKLDMNITSINSIKKY